MEIKIKAPLDKDVVNSLKAGDRVLISGEIYTARDAAHKKMTEALEKGESLPFEIKNQIIYYVGPTPTMPNKIIGSCGPTTSGRMDKYTPKLLELGLLGMIGKGFRSSEVIEAIIKYGAVYFAAIGGAGALISKSVVSVSEIAYSELGTESVKKLVVVDFPAIVAIDKNGNSLY